MDKEELDKQFQEMEGDTQVQAAAAGTPPAPPVRKRITTAQVKKELDELKDFIGDTTVREISQLKAQTDALRANIDDDVLCWIGEIDVRLGKIEEGSLSDRADVAADISARIDNNDAAIRVLSDALRSLLEESSATPQPQPPEIEVAQPPTQADREQNMSYDTMTMAGMCQHMTDVLMICRVLKEAPDIPDTKKNDILHIACQNAGIDLTGGLQIRAGVKFTGA